MSYLLKAVVILSAVLSVYSVALKDCKCWKGYDAKENLAGNVMCYGVFGIKPCNLPERPECVCTKEKVTAVLINEEGTWCIQFEIGKLFTRWPCENKEEWAAYKVKYAEYEKKRKQ